MGFHSSFFAGRFRASISLIRDALGSSNVVEMLRCARKVEVMPGAADASPIVVAAAARSSAREGPYATATATASGGCL